MMRAQQRQRELDRAVHDLLEAVTLQPSIGRQFEARVTDVTDGVARVQLCDDAILGDVAVDKPNDVQPGDVVKLRLVAADPAQRSIHFAIDRPMWRSRHAPSDATRPTENMEP